MFRSNLTDGERRRGAESGRATRERTIDERRIELPRVGHRQQLCISARVGRTKDRWRLLCVSTSGRER